MKTSLRRLNERLSYYRAAVLDAAFRTHPFSAESVDEFIRRDRESRFRLAFNAGAACADESDAMAIAWIELDKGEAEVALAVLEGFVSRESDDLMALADAVGVSGSSVAAEAEAFLREVA
ncbi:hypothetical protein ACX12M_18670 [Cellulosimicrobium cellulans]